MFQSGDEFIVCDDLYGGSYRFFQEICANRNQKFIYVDTSNLSATGSPDATPVTGDPIHPKWFLVIGLAAIAIVLFLKRDAEDKLRTA